MKASSITILILLVCGFFSDLFANPASTIFKSVTVSEGLNNNTIYDVIQDKEGFIWLSTDMGISRYDGYRFRNYPFINKSGAEGKSTVALPKGVAQMSFDVNGLVYLRLLQGGVACFDWAKESYLPVAFNRSFDQNKINSFYLADTQVLYLGTSEGLYTAEVKWQKGEAVELILPDAPLVKGNVSKLSGDGEGHLFFCVDEKEVIYYSMGTRQKKTISPLITMSAPVAKLYVHGDYLWICSKKAEVGCYDYKRDTYRALVGSGGTADMRISNTYITDIVAGNDATYYLSTGMGVFYLKFDSDNLHNAPYTVGMIGQDDNFPIEHKITTLNWNQSEDILWIGTLGGGLIWIPYPVENKHLLPKKVNMHQLVLSDLWVQGKQLRTDEKANGQVVLVSAPNVQKEYRFRGEDNDFSFFFSDFQFGKEPTRIAYRLLPDEAWDTSIIEGGIRYRHLQAGEYTLQVKMLGINGSEGEIYEIPIVIEKYWWCSTWAIVVYVLLGCGLIGGVFYMLLQQTKKRILEHCKEEVRVDEPTLVPITQELSEHFLKEEKIRNIVFSRFMQELRTPLSLIISPLKEVMQEKELAKGLSTKILVAYRNSIGMLNSCNQLMGVYTYSPAKEKIEIAPYNIVKITDAFVLSMNEFLRVHPIGFQYEKKLRKDMEVWIDKKMIELVLQNLLANAFIHVNYSGAVALILQEVVENEISYCTISVVDNGRVQVSTVAELGEDLQKLATVELAAVELGFPMMQDIVKWHHGSISLENLRGGGTKVQVKWPIDKAIFEQDDKVVFIDPEKQDEVVLPEPVSVKTDELEDGNEEQLLEEEPMETERERKTILVVEDYKDIQLYLKTLFEKEYNVLLATNGEEGINMAKKELPDLILCDIMMPVKDGYECCREVKNSLETCHIPFVLLTAKVEDDDVIKGLEMGADDYILKPFVAKILKVKIKNLIEGRISLKKMYTKLLVTPPTDSQDGNVAAEKEAEIEDPFISTVVRIIEENILEPDFNVKKLASDLNMSQPTLYRKVKQCTDFTIIELIRGVRMRRAATLLKKKQNSVQEVAEMVGYNDIPTFRKHFVDTYGATPSTYADSDVLGKK